MKIKIVSIIISFTCLSFTQIFSQEKCKVFKSEISDKYEGKCKNGLAHGKGVAVGKDKYEGVFKNGLPHGKGKYTWSTGEIYDGNWKEGMRNGEGRYLYKKNGIDSMKVGIWAEDVFIKPLSIKSYQIIISRDIDRYIVRKIGEGNSVSLQMNKMGVPNSDINDLSFTADNGSYRTESMKGIYYEMIFPVTLKVSYTTLNKTRNYTLHPVFEIVFNEPGVWEIILFN